MSKIRRRPLQILGERSIPIPLLVLSAVPDPAVLPPPEPPHPNCGQRT
ncbi:hypothetical protein [Azospirillum endophyticum]